MADLKYHISPDNILFVLSFLFVNCYHVQRVDCGYLETILYELWSTKDHT